MSLKLTLRYKLLVHTLAIEDDFERERELRILGELWGVAWRSEDERHPDRYISKLARLISNETQETSHTDTVTKHDVTVSEDAKRELIENHGLEDDFEYDGPVEIDPPTCENHQVYLNADGECPQCSFERGW